ncbi:hypothetical protein CLV62_1077 [Dysgonomonas alginatilytica]|uniref:Uncharacterized protein n=1 Tax=Dysgonomonas alginatilytica TaxID=1605892 RepID=A0A2V3PX47_9BACT|nr:hypothetical protein [Dysgonomonas alginatilytica]PXV65415.1 hypothetical protein CLV62_1077 [Dysgonomonas alginatilytica]
MVKRLFFLILLLCWVVNIFGQADFKGTKFDQVLIISYGGSVVDHINFDFQKLGVEVDTLQFKHKAFLTIEEGRSLYDLLVDKSSYKGIASICWIPHLCIYFLKENKTVNVIEVCMDCNRLQSVLRIKEADPVKYKGGVNMPKGLSPSLNEYLQKMMEKYSLDYRFFQE